MKKRGLFVLLNRREYFNTGYLVTGYGCSYSNAIFILTHETIFFICFSVYQKFMDSVIGMAIMATGLPIYYIFVRNSYPVLQRKTEKFTVMLQKLLLIVEQDLEEFKDN